MSQRIRIISGRVKAEAELNDQPTACGGWEALPIEARAMTGGDEIYFDIPVEMSLEPDARAEMAVGELEYRPTGNALPTFFGPTPARSGNASVAASPVNILGRVLDDPSLFRAIQHGDTMRVEAIT